MINISSNTKFIGLIGYPLGHSLSPVMQNAAFQSKGINNVYLPIEVKPDNLETVVKAIPNMNFDGFNVTIPFKVEIMKYLHEVDELAKGIGAVNTVVIKDGRLKGYNTDGSGFLCSLEEGIGSKVEDKSFFVLGSGGASRAVCMTLAMNNARKIYICNRTIEKAKVLVSDINARYGNSIIVVPMVYENMKETLKDADILINTTSVGTYPKVDEIPIDKNLLNSELTIYDVIYNPNKTKLLLEAEKLGCRIISGLGMLVYQGAKAFELWTGVKAPVELMFQLLQYDRS